MKRISLLKRLLKTLEEHLNQHTPKFYPANSERALVPLLISMIKN